MPRRKEVIRNKRSRHKRLATIFGRFPEVLTVKLPQSLYGIDQDGIRDGYHNALLGFYFYCFLSNVIVHDSAICNSLPHRVVCRIRNIISKDLQFTRKAIEHLDPKLVKGVPVYTLLRYQEAIFRP